MAPHRGRAVQLPWFKGRLGASNHAPHRRCHQPAHLSLNQSQLNQPCLMRLGNRSAHETPRDETQRRKLGRRQIRPIQHVFHGPSDLQDCWFFRHRNNNRHRQPHGSPHPPIIEQQFPDRPQNSKNDEGRHGHERDDFHDDTDTRLSTLDVNRTARKQHQRWLASPTNMS